MSNSPQPPPVFQARDKIIANGRLPENTTVKRKYFCRSCGREVEGTCIPRGWYLLSRSNGNMERHQRLGIFCSATCLERQVPRLKGIEDKLGDAWDTVPSAFRE